MEEYGGGPPERGDGLGGARGGGGGLRGDARGLCPPPPPQSRARRRRRSGLLAVAQPFSHYDRVLRKMRVVEANRTGENAGQFMIMMDNVSLLEVATYGSVDDLLDFLHYCVTLTSEMDYSLVVLIHEDIYSSEECVGLLLHLRYIADLVIKAAPLSTGLAADVHGQLSVVNKGMFSEQRPKVWNLHSKAKENGADFFYPGSRH